MALKTGQNTQNTLPLESRMITWPECFYAEDDAAMRFALLEEAERQELTPEDNRIRRFLLEHRCPGYPQEKPLTDHYLKLWFYLIFAADSRGSKRSVKDVDELVQQLGFSTLETEQECHLLYREFFHTALFFISISLADKNYSTGFLNLNKLSDEKLMSKLGKDIFKAAHKGTQAAPFPHSDLWEQALKDAYTGYYNGAGEYWEKLLNE